MTKLIAKYYTPKRKAWAAGAGTLIATEAAQVLTSHGSFTWAEAGRSIALALIVAITTHQVPNAPTPEV